jgi:DNA-directed RNA polymerase sigma subunit (sigma70/sigma32)
MLSKDMRTELLDKISEASIAEKPKAIFRYRWGLDDGTYRSSREAAKTFNTNHQTIIENENKVFSVIGIDKQDLIDQVKDE